jgi:hypothetical protein
MTNRPGSARRLDRIGSGHAGPDSPYAIGVSRLVSGYPDALGPLSDAVERQPDRAASHMALACALAESGNPEQAEVSRRDAVARVSGASRRERQQVQILSAVLEGRVAHALGLAFEHLEEFPDDQLVTHSMSVAVARRSDRILSAELEALFGMVQKKA